MFAPGLVRAFVALRSALADHRAVANARLALVLVALTSLAGCAHADELEEIRGALAKGRVAVLLVDLPDPADVEADDERLGDYAEYLNDFSARAPEDLFEFIRVAATDIDGIKGLNGPLEPLSVVFLRSDQSYVANGGIFEPDVYSCVQARYTGEQIADWVVRAACPEKVDFTGL